MQKFENIYKAGHMPWAGGYLYLASVFRKHPVGLFQAYNEAREAQGALWKAGINVFSPIACFYPTAVWEDIDLTDNDWWFELDLPHMRGARGIIVLRQKNWAKSDGISRERKFFADRNSPEYSLDYPICL